MPSLSLVPAELKLIGSPTRVEVVPAVATTVGGTFGIGSTSMVTDEESVAPSTSLTVSVAV